MTKKKKRGGRKTKSRSASKDQFSEDDQDIIMEELTALTAIFQEDIKIISQSPQPHFHINLRPHSDERGYENLEVSAILSVRCFPGYPYKSPKLRVVPEKGLKKEDAEKLASLLSDQASANAREGRVMIFNLVEVAQEFLSEVLLVQEPTDNVSCLDPREKDELFHGDVSITCKDSGYSEENFVSGLYDLFSDLCSDDGSWHQAANTFVNDDLNKISRSDIADINENRRKITAIHNVDAFKIRCDAPKLHPFLKSEATLVDANEDAQMLPPLLKLNIFAERTSQTSASASSQVSSTSSEEYEQKLTTHLEAINSKLENHTSATLTALDKFYDDKFREDKKDIFMAYLLRLACSMKGSLKLALPEITSELYNLGMLSEQARDLAAQPVSAFNKIFSSTFRQHLISSRVSEFWRGVDIMEETSSPISSRYLNDFEEIRLLGVGGFGLVVLCKNKLDGRQYAVKKIHLKTKSSPFNEKILREVATLARLQHQHVVRYYQAWFETEHSNHDDHTLYTSETAESSDWHTGSCSTNAVNQILQESTYLYIQMEYCPRTLRDDFETFERFVDKELIWHQFRQIAEGLSHIHSQGIIHRDLTPNNIFFDARNDIKIGDFGLAKFLKVELDQDFPLPADATGTSVDGTGQVGTYFYTAPEIEQGWPQINEKADMYSLGIVFFELWHPFGTAMERHAILSDLKSKGSLPPAWISEFPEQSSLVQHLLSPIPSDRPSARELLRTVLPPRMEDEWLNDILRTIQTSEDTYVYDRVISTIFDEERINVRVHRHVERAKQIQDQSSFTQFSELESAFRDMVQEVAKEIFRKHGAKRLEITPICLPDGFHESKRKIVKVLSSGGDMLELCHELRSPFVSWIIKKQIFSFKRYEISWVHRRGIGHSIPNRFMQGDFDIVGGTPSVIGAEAIKVSLELACNFFPHDHLEVRLNHGQILAAIWSWVGIEGSLRQSVANVLSSLSAYSPQSAKRKSQWVLIRRQLLQGLNLAKQVVDKLQAVDSRFCGLADKSLARLRGALSPDNLICKALEEISVLVNYLRVWKIVENIALDVLMPPEESYYRGITFQLYVINESNIGSMLERTLLAAGGCYDHLLHAMWEHKSTVPSAVGVSIGLEKILHHPLADIRPSRNESSTPVLVCSRGGGGLLEERMELIDELWQANIKADFVPFPGCSLTAQYDYANDHDIKLLIIITEAGLSQTDSVEKKDALEVIFHFPSMLKISVVETPTWSTRPPTILIPVESVGRNSSPYVANASNGCNSSPYVSRTNDNSSSRRKLVDHFRIRKLVVHGRQKFTP